MATEINNSKSKFENQHQYLIDLCRRGDQKAQFQIYKLYFKAMFNTSLRIVNNPMEAEDIMQESFLSAFEKIGTYSGTVSFGAWIKSIVVKRSIDALRRNGRMVFEDVDSIYEIESDSQEDYTRDEDTDSGVRNLPEAVKTLPQGCRIVFSLYLLEGYDHDEIAEILSISPATSRSQLSIAKQRLLRQIA